MDISRGITGIWQITHHKNVSNAVPLKIRFFIPPTAYGLHHLPLSYSIQDFETYSGTTSSGTSHTHSVTISNHTHSVTTNNHTHNVTIADHTHGVTVAAHTHTVTVPDHTHQYTIWTGSDSWDTYIMGAQARGATNVFVEKAGGPAITLTDSGGTTSPTSADGGAASLTSAAGGATTPTSSSSGGEVISTAAGGSTTPTTSADATHTHTISPLMATSAADVNDITISVDGVDKTAALEAIYGILPITDAEDMEIYGYLSEPILNAWHEVIITPNGVNTPPGMCYMYAYLSPEQVIKEV